VSSTAGCKSRHRSLNSMTVAATGRALGQLSNQTESWGQHRALHWALHPAEHLPSRGIAAEAGGQHIDCVVTLAGTSPTPSWPRSVPPSSPWSTAPPASLRLATWTMTSTSPWRSGPAALALRRVSTEQGGNGAGGDTQKYPQRPHSG